MNNVTEMLIFLIVLKTLSKTSTLKMTTITVVSDTIHITPLYASLELDPVL